MQEIDQTVERVELDESSFSVDTDGVTSVDASGIQQSLSGIADSFDVNGFKCVKCGLVHMHDTMKHRLTDTFDISDGEAASMEYDPNCHCGAHEAAERGSDLGIDETKATNIANKAPIPPGTME